MKQYLYILITLLPLFTFAQMKPSLYQRASDTLVKKSVMIDVQGEYLISSGNFDDQGEKIEFFEGESFSRFQSKTMFYYGLRDNLQIGLGLRYRMNSAEITPSTETFSLSSAGLESLYGNLKYAFKRSGKWGFAAEFEFRNSLYTNEEYLASAVTEELVLGDGESSWKIGGHLTYFMSKNKSLDMSAFYHLKSDYSAEVLYDVHFAIPMTSFAFLLGIDGIYSLGNDPYGEFAVDRPLAHSGSTALYNSVNRSHISPYLKMNFAFSNKWRGQVGYSTPLIANSHAMGHTVLFGITYQSKSKETRSKVINRFKDYNIEANVVKVSPRKAFVRIDRGLTSEIEKGMQVDIYEFDYFGGNVLLATGIVHESSSSKAIIRIKKFYQRKTRLKAGNIARLSN